MKTLFKEIRHNPLLWLLVFVPTVFAAAKLRPEAHTLLFVLSVLGIVPLGALLSHATESVAAKTGDAIGSFSTHAAKAFRMTPAFVGFIVVALVGGAAEMTSAFSAARKNRLDMNVGIALGSAS